jgi:release factor glutamine methyltransferase
VTTIKRALQDATNLLQLHDVDEAQLNAEYLLSYVLDISKSEVLLNKERTLTSAQSVRLLELLQQRCKRVPLQYLVGNVYFYNIKLNISKGVLIPRPETEELVAFFVEEVKTRTQEFNILDIGSGSGCISLAIAAELPLSNVLGIDISENAVQVANMNKVALGIKNAEYKHINLLDFIYNNKQKFEYIISNPPYISADDYKNLDAELYFEPRIALTDEKDGLQFYRIISSNLDKLLKPEGKLFLECGVNQSTTIQNIFREQNYDTAFKKDFAGIERYLFISKN